MFWDNFLDINVEALFTGHILAYAKAQYIPVLYRRTMITQWNQ